MIDTAILLAAGKGRRLENVYSPKPLLTILPSKNIRFIDHHILGLIKLGVKRIIIVVGYKKDEIINYVKTKNYEKKYNIKIDFVENNEVEKYPEIGSSIYLGVKYAKKLGIKFTYLICCDHYLDYNTLKLIINEFLCANFDKLSNYSVVYFFTKNCKTMKPEQCSCGFFDKDSKLIKCVKNKNIEYYDNIALSIGFYIINVEKISQKVDKIDNLNFEFQDFLNNIKNEVYPVIINNFIWFGINNKEEFENFKKQISYVFAKPKCLISKYINNPLSQPLIKHIINKKYISPNILTFLSLLFGISCSIFIILSFYWFYFIFLSITLYFIKSIFDTADGIIARVFQETSSIGHILDRSFDILIDSLIFISLSFFILFYTKNVVLHFLILILFSVYQLYYIVSELLGTKFKENYKNYNIKRKNLFKLFQLFTPRDTQLISIWMFSIIAVWLPQNISIIIYLLWIIFFVILTTLKLYIGFKLENLK